MGVARFKHWVETVVIDPHVKPIQTSLEGINTQLSTLNGTVARQGRELAAVKAYLEGQTGQPLGSIKE